MANFTLDQTGQEIQDILDTVGNNQATQGQVLTANGNGGASWQNASGGKLYQHNIEMNFSSVASKLSNAYIFFTIICDRSTAFTRDDLWTYMKTKFGTENANDKIPCGGYGYVNSFPSLVIAICANFYSNQFTISFEDKDTNGITTSYTAGRTYGSLQQDKVIEL